MKRWRAHPEEQKLYPMFATMGARNGRSQVVAEALQDLQRFKESEEMRLFKTFHSWKKKISWMSHIYWKQPYLCCSRDGGRLWVVKPGKLYWKLPHTTIHLEKTWIQKVQCTQWWVVKKRTGEAIKKVFYRKNVKP